MELSEYYCTDCGKQLSIYEEDNIVTRKDGSSELVCNTCLKNYKKCKVCGYVYDKFNIVTYVIIISHLELEGYDRDSEIIKFVSYFNYLTKLVITCTTITTTITNNFKCFR